MAYDVIVIGAGAAGVSCATTLKNFGMNVLILEAKPRPFGRVLTIRPPHVQAPIELGAEFVHGAPKELIALSETHNIPLMDVCDNHLVKVKNHFKDKADFFEHLDKVLPQKLITKDQSVHDWLEKKSVSKIWKNLVKNFIEGFHAADLNRMGQNALVSSGNQEEDELNGSTMFRIPFGYDQLLQIVAQDLDQDNFRFNTVVNGISWQKGQVRISFRSAQSKSDESISASKVVVTVPIGCLKRKTISFEPRILEMEKNLESVEMGHVQRLVFRFQNRFWEKFSKEKPPSFFHLTSDTAFKTWWTGAPLRANCLTAWCGGPRAEEMASWNEAQLISQALLSLSELSGKSSKNLRQNIMGTYSHNWSQDPFAHGAYSYILTDGLNSAKRLSRPIEDTIYFAGEGLQVDSSRGTVHGALCSGYKTGNLILKAEAIIGPRH